ncbi:MAG: putative Ig domain-containing protein, partial [Pirellulaceae bacterium]|nr:putative Ig domain-containing protein [Pirellulaceae bacterium]
TEPAAIPDPVPADVATIRLRDGAGNPVGPVHTFSTVEHVIILPPPTGIALMPWGLPENTDTGDENVEVGQFEALSQIAGAECTFSLVAGSGDDDNGRFVILDDRLFLRQGTLLDYESQALYAVRVRVSNGFDHVDRQFGVAVTDVNEVPELMQPIPNQSATENVPFLLAADAFRDPDAGDVLSYSATLGDGSPLPSWLSFDDPTRTFSGRPGFTDEGQLMIVVRATDSGTPPLARATTFELMVMPNAVPWQNPTNRWDVDASGSPSDPFPGDVLAVINFINARGIVQLPAPPSSLGPPPYLDVTGDGWVTPADVLDIINVINGRIVSGGESEPTFAAVPPIGTGAATVPTADFASFDYDQGRRVESGRRRDREEAVSAIMGKWTPADEYLDCILAPSDTARPFYLRSADAARNEGQAGKRTGNAEEDWLLFGWDQGPAADLLDELLTPTI